MSRRMAPVGGDFAQIVGAAPAEDIATIARSWVRWKCEDCGAALGINARYCPIHAAEERERWRSSAIDAARSSIPRRYRDHRFDSVIAQCKQADHDERWVKDGRALVEARKSIDEPQLMLVGPAGHGKTTLAGCICNAILDAAKPGCDDAVAARAAGLFWVRATVLQQARREWKLGQGESPIVTRAARATVLVIDDFGREVDTSAREQNVVAEVIFERHEQHRQTLVTTWLTPEEVGQRYDGGTSRRLFEDAFIVLVGASKGHAAR
jgi:DNA replication protein DnaC